METKIDISPHPDLAEMKEKAFQGETRKKLIGEAIDKPVRKVVQWDAFFNITSGDDLMRPDKDGDAILYCHTWELRKTGGIVRVQFDPDLDRKAVVRVLKKIAKSIQKYGQEELGLN